MLPDSAFRGLSFSADFGLFFGLVLFRVSGRDGLGTFRGILDGEGGIVLALYCCNAWCRGCNKVQVE